MMVLTVMLRGVVSVYMFYDIGHAETIKYINMTARKMDTNHQDRDDHDNVVVVDAMMIV